MSFVSDVTSFLSILSILKLKHPDLDGVIIVTHRIQKVPLYHLLENWLKSKKIWEAGPYNNKLGPSLRYKGITIW